MLRVAAFATLFMAAVIPAPASASNIGGLMGMWVPVHYEPIANMPSDNPCFAKIEFAAKTNSMWDRNHPDWKVYPQPVTYLDLPRNSVGVRGNSGQTVVYTFIDARHIFNVADVHKCVYQR